MRLVHRDLNSGTRPGTWVALALVLGAAPGSAAPLLGSGRDVAGVRVYRDHPDGRTYYYAPGRLSIAADAAGKPQISFLQMRYTGTAVAGDRGAFRTMSNLTFRVRMEPVTAAQLAQVRTTLRTAAGDPILKPLPIRKVTAQLNYLPLKEATPAPTTPGMPAGAARVEETEDPAGSGGYWTERYFTLNPDDATSSLLWDSFQKGQVLLSLAYAFYSDGIDASEPVPGGVTPAKDPPKKGPHLVAADTLTVAVDAAKYPDRIRRIDINESLPAQYAALSIACYDFNNALRPDLQVKIVEVEAKSVTGQPLRREVSFTAASPDLTAASLRFPFAVSLRQGYRYRVREITPAGEEKVKAWQDGPAWTQLLDVTTPPAERPAAPPEREDP